MRGFLFSLILVILIGCTLNPAPTASPGPTAAPSVTATTMVVPVQQTEAARSTQIVLSRTREAEARIRQTLTGPVTTATYTPQPPTQTPEPPEPTWPPWWTFTPDPSPTSTPQPTLQAHTFNVKPILAELLLVGGYFIEYPPKIILYGDGLIVFHDYDRTKPGWNTIFRPMGRILTRKEICRLLNTIDQVGFFDYDRDTYVDVLEENPIASIHVNAWRENFSTNQRLWSWVYEGDRWYVKKCITDARGCLPPPIILPALSSTYKLLFEYNPGDLQALPVDRMLLGVLEPWTEDPTNDMIWPMQSPSLHDLLAMRDPSDEYNTFVVSDPAWVNRLYRMVQTGVYAEGDLRLHVIMRPMLPYEEIVEGWSDFSARLTIPPGTTISCTPEDGLLPIPR